MTDAGALTEDAKPAQGGGLGLRAQLESFGKLRTGALAMGAGAVGAFGHAPLHAWPATVFAFTIFVLLIDVARSHEDRMLGAALWRGWCFGFGYFLAGLWWVSNAFLVDPERYAVFVPVAVTALPAILALFWAVGALACVALWSPGWRRVLLFAGVFAVIEYARGHLFTGFPWNLPGHIWPAGGEVSQAAAVIGVYGLSALTLFACASPAALFGQDRHAGVRIAPVIVAFVAFALMFGGGLGRLHGASAAIEEGVRLRIVQPQIDQEGKWRPENRDAVVDQYLRLSRSEGLEDRTHILWPESALPLLLLEEPRVLDRIAKAVGEGRVIMTGATRRDMSNPLEPLFFNSFMVLRIDYGTPLLHEVYDKTRLVPWGEYLPFPDLMERLGVTSLVSLGGAYTPGLGPVSLTTPGAPNVAPQICYEAAFSGFTPRGQERPGWIVNVSNDAWYGQSPGPRQHFNLARYRALEEGLPLVRAASGGVSAVIDPYGRMIAGLPIEAEGVVDADLPSALAPTPYARLGDILAFGLMGILLFFGRIRGRN